MSANTVTQQPKLEARIREACRVRHYSLSTERAYVLWYKQFVRWSGMKHPATLGGDRVEAWLSHLATERNVSASTQRQALAAILFLYKQVLGMNLPWLENITRAKQPQRLPRVLSQPEIKAVLAHLPRTSAGLAVALVYGALTACGAAIAHSWAESPAHSRIVAVHHHLHRLAAPGA